GYMSLHKLRQTKVRQLHEIGQEIEKIAPVKLVGNQGRSQRVVSLQKMLGETVPQLRYVTLLQPDGSVVFTAGRRVSNGDSWRDLLDRMATAQASRIITVNDQTQVVMRYGLDWSSIAVRAGWRWLTWALLAIV